MGKTEKTEYNGLRKKTLKPERGMVRMKKWIALALALMMTAAACLCAAEEQEEEGALSRLFLQGRALILETDNVTLEGTAAFYLDGTEFKRAKATYIQDGLDAYQRIELTGTDNEGVHRQTEYAVLDNDGTAYASEIYHGREHVLLRYRVPSVYILTETRAIHQLLNLTQDVCRAADSAPGIRKTAETTENGGRKTTLEIQGSELPPVADSTLNLLWQFVWNRYYRPGYEQLDLPDRELSVIGDYGTPAEGIVLTTRTILLESAEAEIQEDGEGRITSADGEIRIVLNTAYEGQREVKAVFSLKAGMYGTSRVMDNDEVQSRMAYALRRAPELPGWIQPDDGPAEESDPPQEYVPEFDESEIPPVPEFEESAVHRPIADADEAAAYAQEIWSMPCFGTGDLSGYLWTVTESEHGYFQVWGRNPEDVPAHYLQMEIGGDGWIYSLKNAECDLDQAMVTFESSLSDEAHAEYNLRLDGMVRRFADQLNPGYTDRMNIRTEDENVNGIYYFGTGDMLYSGENRFLLLYSEPWLEDTERETRTKIGVQTAPVTRIVFYNELNNRMEGGNG